MNKPIKIEYPIGSIVVLRTDPDQMQRIVVEIRIIPGNIILYKLSCGPECTEHYQFEIDGEQHDGSDGYIPIQFSSQ